MSKVLSFNCNFVYDNKLDVWTIPQQLQSLYREYRFLLGSSTYVRQHEETLEHLSKRENYRKH